VSALTVGADAAGLAGAASAPPGPRNVLPAVHPISAADALHRDERVIRHRRPARLSANLEDLRMSFALSQRRPDRHPVGLLIVVGLHVVLAAALLSAKLQQTPPRETFVPLQPIDEPVKPPPPRPVEPPPPTTALPKTAIVVPVIDSVEPPPDAIVVEKNDDKPLPPAVQVASIGPDDDTVHKPARIEPRAARISAGAAQCHPEYPAAAQRAGATGSTRIRFTVDALGHIAGSQILHASGSTREHRLMDQAAAAALARCPVQVGTDDQGRPVGTTTDVEYVWSLN
jgi:protein TonB